MQLLLLHYNNYFNRIIKKEETVAAYMNADAHYRVASNVNFNPGDGVNTSLVLGLGQNGTLFDVDEFDYLVAYEIVDDVSVIRSRWFVLEQDRKRGGQYELTLKRDVLADNYSSVINSPIFIEKGFINDPNDPLLYNSESMSLNQIKQFEMPLKDETESGWVVGYIPSDAFPKVEPEYDRVEKEVTVPMSADITVNGLSSWNYWNYCSANPNYKFMADIAGKRKVTVKIRSQKIWASSGRTARCDMVTANYTFYPNSSDAGVYSQKNTGFIENSSGSWNFPQWYEDYGPVTFSQGTLSAKICANIFDPVRNNGPFNAALNTILGNGISIGDTSALRQLKDKIIYDSSTNTYYRISVISTSAESPMTVTSSVTGGQTALTALKNAMHYPNGAGGSLYGDYAEFTASNSSTSYAIQLTNVGVSLYVDLNSDRAHLNDAPYDMFCIPFSDTLKLKYGDTQFTCSKNVALSMATEIAKDLGSKSVYDVQLLPYCPNRTLVVKSTSPSSVLDLTGVKYDLIKESVTNAPKSAVIWCAESTFQVPITTESQVVEFKITEDSPLQIKTESYYAVPNGISAYSNRMAVSTANKNGVLVYKVDKSSGRVTDRNWYDVLEIKSEGYLNIYAFGNWQNPEISVSIADYANADYYYVFWLRNGAFGGQFLNKLAESVKIAKDYSVLNPGNDALNRKLANECDLLRLVAQNYSAIFEFSPAKSGGVDGFLADCTYKPWSPYIHILPKLKGLYGDNFVTIDDARGLICGGDMSLSQLSNEWANYQLQNKTYQEMFDRQIKNMDVQNDVNRQGALAQAIVAPIVGGSAGAATGAKIGGGYGAIAGAAAGAIGGAITAGIDYSNAVRMMEENRQYSIDMYGYNLQNIQAIPTSLTKTSALTYNTRVWPFIEYYTCTESERKALKDKIKYNGMTVMKIGQLSDYPLGEDRFYKGQVIRLNTNMDSHMAYEIYNELKKGVYL